MKTKKKIIDESIESNTTTDPDKIDELGFSVPLSNVPKKERRASMMIKSFFESFRHFPSNVEVNHFKSKIVKFNYVVNNKRVRVKFLMVIFVALVMGLLTTLLVKNSGLYSLGINGIWQGIARITRTSMLVEGSEVSLADNIYNIIFWTMNVVINIPLVIFAYKKVSKQFAYLTMMYVIFSQMFGFVIDYIPGMDEIHIFGKVGSIGASDIKYINNAEAIIKQISFSHWGNPTIISLLVYAIIFGIFSGFCFSLVLMVGASSGGADVFSVYMAKKKNKPIGTLLLIINNTCLFISTIIGTLGSLLVIDTNIVVHGSNYDINTKYSNENSASNVIQCILSPNFLFSVIMAIIGGLTIDFIYPRSKFVQIKVYTNDAETFKNSLMLIGYKHDIYVNHLRSGTDANDNFTIETICMYIELPSVLNAIRAVDQNCLITINKLQDIDGDMNVIN